MRIGTLFRATKKTDELSFRDYHDKMVLAYDINDFFFGKITTRIRADIDATPMDYAVSIDSEVGKGHTCLFLRAFHPLTESEV